MVLRTFNFWGFCGPYRKTIVFNDMFSKKSLKSMVLSTFNFWGVLSTFNFWGFCGGGRGGGGCGPLGGGLWHNCGLCEYTNISQIRILYECIYLKDCLTTVWTLQGKNYHSFLYIIVQNSRN